MISALSFSVPGLLVALGLKEEDKDSEKNPIVLAIKRALMAQSSNDIDMSNDILHEALEIAIKDRNEKAVTYIYNLLADNYAICSEYEKSEALYKDVLSRILSTGQHKEDDDAVIDISLQLAKIYARRKEYTKADVGYQFCVDNQERKLLKMGVRSKSAEQLTPEEFNSMALYGMIFDERSRYYARRFMHEKAYNDIIKAMNISVILRGEHDRNTITLINDVGVISDLNGKYDEAIKHFTRAAVLGRAVGHGDLPVYYLNLGMAQAKLGLVDEAFENCIRTSKMVVDGSGLTNPS